MNLNHDFTLSRIIPDVIRGIVGRVHTTTLGRVDDYDLNGQRVDVTPIVNYVFENGDVLEYSKLFKVPVVFPGGDEGGITFGIKSGDVGLLVFCERSIDEALESGVKSTPVDPRRYHLSDVVFIPGILTGRDITRARYSDATEVTCGEVRVVLRNGKVAIGVGGTELLDLISSTLQALSIATVTVGPTTVPLNNVATFTALKVQLDLIRGEL